MNNALAQRSALVRTMIVDGKDLVVLSSEDGDLAFRQHKGHPYPHDNVLLDALRIEG